MLLGMYVVFYWRDIVRIFIVCGKAGSGKNEVAKIIKNNLSKTVITSLAKYIKLFALEMTEWNGSDDDKPREFLQNMGDTLRSIDSDYLTKRLLEDMKVYEKFYDNVIISDVRLLHELEFFKNCNYDVVSIRVNSKTSKRNLTSDEKLHHTETDLDSYDNFDYVINNEFDDRLEDNVIEILEGLK